MADANAFGEMNLSIIGIGSEYPPYALDCKALETMSSKFYPETPA
jgi:fungal type III polyketide synthase